MAKIFMEFPMKRLLQLSLAILILLAVSGCNKKPKAQKRQIPRGYMHPYAPYPIGKRDCITIQMQNGLMCNTCTSCPEGIAVTP